jgi:hypothetical protein
MLYQIFLPVSLQTISTATSSNDAALNVRATHPFSVPLAVFLRLADMPEALHGLSMIWEETYVCAQQCALYSAHFTSPLCVCAADVNKLT